MIGVVFVSGAIIMVTLSVVVSSDFVGFGVGVLFLVVVGFFVVVVLVVVVDVVVVEVDGVGVVEDDVDGEGVVVVVGNVVVVVDGK